MASAWVAELSVGGTYGPFSQESDAIEWLRVHGGPGCIKPLEDPMKSERYSRLKLIRRIDEMLFDRCPTS